MACIICKSNLSKKIIRFWRDYKFELCEGICERKNFYSILDEINKESGIVFGEFKKEKENEA